MDNIKLEGLEDWVQLDATKSFRKQLDGMYYRVLEEASMVERGEKRDAIMDTAKGIKLVIMEFDITTEDIKDAVT